MKVRMLVKSIAEKRPDGSRINIKAGEETLWSGSAAEFMFLSIGSEKVQALAAANARYITRSFEKDRAITIAI